LQVQSRDWHGRVTYVDVLTSNAVLDPELEAQLGLLDCCPNSAVVFTIWVSMGFPAAASDDTSGGEGSEATLSGPCCTSWLTCKLTSVASTRTRRNSVRNAIKDQL
jgi:hypothetical protein